MLTFIIGYFNFLPFVLNSPARLHFVPEKLCSHGVKMGMIVASKNASKDRTIPKRLFYFGVTNVQ
jgi:hypothetical protein